jgi:NAD-dependent dihydropyrimidine dehydrogenase PreA subunit
MTYVIAESCIDLMDRSCVDVCPVGADTPQVAALPPKES